jgi:hypothetical protein
MLVCIGDDRRRMTDLRGRKTGLSKSLDSDCRRVAGEGGIELALYLNGMTRDDVGIVDRPFADDRCKAPDMAAPIKRGLTLSHGYIRNDLDVHEWAVLAIVAAATRGLDGEAPSQLVPKKRWRTAVPTHGERGAASGPPLVARSDALRRPCHTCVTR